MEKKISTAGSLYSRDFSAHLDRVRLNSGRTADRIRIEHPDAAAVLPLLDEERIVMVRQYRYAIGGETLEIPAGKLDPGEEMRACAERELTEETGYEAAGLVSLFRYYPAIGYSSEMLEIFAAAGLAPREPRPDGDEISGIEIVRLDQVYDLVSAGRIRDGKTVIAVSLFLARRDRSELPAEFLQTITDRNDTSPAGS